MTSPAHVVARLLRRAGWLFSATILLLCLGHAASPPTEYEVKAAFLLNFAKFIDWPSMPPNLDVPFMFCILGEDPFGPTLAKILEGEKVAGHRLVSRRVQGPDSNCQVLFIGKSEKGVPRILAETPRGVLAVGESDDFLRQGGMISFALDNRRVRFDINPRAAESAGLKISSRLLAVARTLGGRE
jgi:hypothetical protein